MDSLAMAVPLGVGATALIDLWALARRRLLGIAPPNWGLVGRWIGHMPRGRFVHDSIAAAPPVRGEPIIGWVAHYLIGIAYAAILLVAAGAAWLEQPTPGPALLVGIGTVAAPFFLMQPGMGLGIAASRAPRPSSVRLHSLVMHVLFGFGLYLGGLALQFSNSA